MLSVPSLPESRFVIVRNRDVSGVEPQFWICSYLHLDLPSIILILAECEDLSLSGSLTH